MWNIGQRVVTSHGTVRVIAYTAPNGKVYGYSPRGGYEAIVPVHDAWGGEHDQHEGATLEAAFRRAA